MTRFALSLTQGKTGWPAGSLQDDCRPLSRWLANRVDSRKNAREAAQAIEAGAQRVEVTAPTPEQWRANGGM